ncbi:MULTISPECIES: helix-turn-helix domain-containing protein [Halorussus]|uniref:ArsR/SmtB family transcription factor n=1 Tax=Halorussus TaxID=1070314 RepID=UPI000E20F314|nr:MULTISPECIES: helix-turn-helix domain-containing protein [Halorussus]NHN61273.1 helix-turn-helix transcriptional regulator [Halorussus sp. JP-T4]
MADLLPSSPDPSAGDGGDPRVVGVDSDDAEDLLAALQSETARDILGALYDDPASPSALADEVDTSIQNVRYHLDRLTDADLVEVADTVYSEKGREMKVYAPAAKPLVVFAGSDDDAPGVESALSKLLGALGVLGLSSLLVQRLFGDSTGGVTDSDVSWGGAGDAAGTTAAENATAPGPNAAATTAAESGDSLTGAETTADAGRETATESGRTVAEATRTATEAPRTMEEATRTAAETTRTATDLTLDSTTAAATAGDTAASGLPPGLVFFAGGLVVLLALGIAWHLRAR